jgi:hypothetical protein
MEDTTKMTDVQLINYFDDCLVNPKLFGFTSYGHVIDEFKKLYEEYPKHFRKIFYILKSLSNRHNILCKDSIENNKINIPRIFDCKVLYENELGETIVDSEYIEGTDFITIF